MSNRHDIVAETHLLALAMTGHERVRERFLNLPVTLWHPTREPLATVIRDRMRRDAPLDPITIAADVASSMPNAEQAERMRRLVTDCAATCPPLDAWGYYAEQALTALTVREAVEHAERTLHRLDSAADPGDVASIVKDGADQLTGVVEHLKPREIPPPMTVAEMLNEPDEPYNWLVPQLWERTDRIMVTAFEGVGKSLLLAQFAVAVAAGLHPLSGEPINRHGHRVLLLDFENSKAQDRRRFRSIVASAEHIRHAQALGEPNWEQLRVHIQPRGVNLTEPRELARVEQIIASTAPDLVVAGPLYRMSSADLRDEQACKALLDALDQLRTRYGFTLALEAHVGHVGEAQGGRRLRPTGSSALLRWPEFGIGLRGAAGTEQDEHPSLVDLSSWRGSRDEREWPSRLKHGGTHQLPWVPATKHANTEEQ